MQASESMIFPNRAMQIVAWLIHYLGIAVITHCLSRRAATEELTSRHGLSQLTWPRALVLLIFLDSWLFVFASGVVVFGVGLELNEGMCSAGIYLCIACYATSKLLIYAFLIEKVHIVWSPMAGIPRFKSPVYITCFITVALYCVIITFLLVGRVHYLREGDSVCIIGLKPYSSILVLSYDLYINVFLTTLFLWPLFRSKIFSPLVKKVAVRTLVAAGVALTTSTVNMAVLTILHGRELGWVCLGSCSADVIINALALFWVAGGVETPSIDTISEPPRNPDRHAKSPNNFALEFSDPEKFDQRSQTNSYFPSSSRNLQRTTQDIESEYPSFSSSTPPRTGFRTFTGLFRKDRNHIQAPTQITMTTDIELEYPPSEAESRQSSDISEESFHSHR